MTCKLQHGTNGQHRPPPSQIFSHMNAIVGKAAGVGIKRAHYFYTIH